MRNLPSLALLFCFVLPVSVAMTFRTPPLSEWDFTVTPVYDGTPEVIETTENDVVVNISRTKGSLNVVGSGDCCDGGISYSSSYSGIEIDEQSGEWVSLVTGDPSIKVQTKCLSKYIPINTSVTGAGIGYVAGTLGEHITDKIDALISGVTPNDGTKSMFVNRNEAAGVYEWNPQFWLFVNDDPEDVNSVDLTCYAPWRDRQGVGSSQSSSAHWPVIAVTPRHIVCGHVGTWIGETYHFFAQDNTVVARTVTAKAQIADGKPYWVAVLDQDLPASITPAKLLPVNAFTSYMTNSSSYPIAPGIMTDLEKKTFVGIIWAVNGSDWFTLLTPTDGTYLSFYEPVVGGDSSSPAFTVVNGETVLLTTWYTAGAGLNYSGFLNEINAALDSLHGGTSPYYPQTVDLSGFTSF